jgi:hypothetical protein
VAGKRPLAGAPVDDGPLPVVPALENLLQVVRGPEVARCGSSNIQLRPDGTAKIIDFGIGNRALNALFRQEVE